ncbi:hypothetical protein N780_14780 [Pontibacillus chungwhensis BH030062]|uniref:Uncharacterized protein n=1 Tax=Pontibacillus chungwhensis BH030062 TaxID=1385513 RepID=A0A0A2UWT0_9BACI|nr:hypothetical protein N780_14780 [Pontibacillus chungwhensis BH030062]
MPGLARGLRDSRGIRSLGKTPQRAKANEEASQLPAGKRVVPEQARPLIKRNGPFLLNYLSFDFPHKGAYVEKASNSGEIKRRPPMMVGALLFIDIRRFFITLIS